jgi:hypothetical protein
MKSPASKPLAHLQKDRALLRQGLALPLGEGQMAKADCFLVLLHRHWESRYRAVSITLGRKPVIDESCDLCARCNSGHRLDCREASRDVGADDECKTAASCNRFGQVNTVARYRKSEERGRTCHAVVVGVCSRHAGWIVHDIVRVSEVESGFRDAQTDLKYVVFDMLVFESNSL